MAQTTSLVFNGGSIPSPAPTPSGTGKAKLLKIGEITITEQGVQVTKKVICDPDSVTTVAPFMEVLTSAKLAELVNANSVLVLDDGEMQYLMADARVTVEDETPVCTSVSFLGLSRENRAKVEYPCVRITDELTLQQVVNVGDPVETDFSRVLADPDDADPKTLIDKMEVVDAYADPENPDSQPFLKLETIVDEQGNHKVAINEDSLNEGFQQVFTELDYIGDTLEDLPGDEHGYFNSSLVETPGDGTTTSISIDSFRISDGRDVHGESIEFVPTHQEGDIDYGDVYLNPGTYIVSVHYTLQWVGNPRGTFLPLVTNVLSQPFDFSYEHEDIVRATRIVTRTSRQKLTLDIGIDADTPKMGVWVKYLEIAQISSYIHPAVAHDTTLTGNGKLGDPLGVTPAAFGEIKNIPTSISQFRTGDVIPVDGPNGPAKMSRDDLLELTAQNALAGNLAPAFDPIRTEENPYIAYKDSCVYEGELWFFIKNHYGPWDARDVTKNPSMALSTITDGIEYYTEGYMMLTQNKGLDANGGEITINYSVLSDYVPIPNGIGECFFVNPHGYGYGLAIYDENKTCIKVYDAKDSGGYQVTSYWYGCTITPFVDKRAKYARVAGNTVIAGKPILKGIKSSVLPSYIIKACSAIVGINKKTVNYAYKFINKRINLDGTVSDQQYYVCSDFIPIGDEIISVNFGNYDGSSLGIAFYDIYKNFIKGYSAKSNGELVTSLWYKSHVLPDIPRNACYFRISGNPTIHIPCEAVVDVYTSSEVIFSDAPSENKEFFKYYVDCNQDFDAESTNASFEPDLSFDNALIRLPENYSRIGAATPLVLYNHGAGGSVTNDSASGSGSSVVQLLLKRGYAVLFVNGVPENLRNDKYLSASYNGSACHMGSRIFLRSVKKAYDYVVTKYNLSKNVLVAGQSLGGLASLNLLLNKTIPISCVALDAPVIDLYRDAYYSGGWSGGSLNASTQGCVAWMYGWNDCDFEAGTYTIDGVTKSLSELKNSASDMENLWSLNKDKMFGYNPYLEGDCLVSSLDASYIYDFYHDTSADYFGKLLGVPIKIWFGTEDTVNQLGIARNFITKIRKANGCAQLRTIPTSQHCVWNAVTTQGTNPGIDISTTVDGITVGICGAELVYFFDENK